MAQEPARKRRRFDTSNDSLPGFIRWNLEDDYTSKARKTKKSEQRQKLPLKTAEGDIVQQKIEIDDERKRGVDQAPLGDDETDSAIADVQSEPKPHTPKVSRKEEILRAKEELARLAGLLSENPEEHVGLLGNLKDFVASENTVVKRLALGTQIAVYKDIVPGYRIRPLSKDDMQAKVSKDVKKLRSFEQGLLGGYKEFVHTLSRLAKRRGSQDLQEAGLASVAISCVCNLLTSIPHFNFRNDLIDVVVSCLAQRSSASDADFIRAVETTEQIFRDDEEGHLSREAVFRITKMFKSKNYQINESVLNTFLHLRLLNEFSGKASTERVDKASDGADDNQPATRQKQKREYRSKSLRKSLKERKAVEKEMKEADAAVSHEERDQNQAETLKLVFITYFRILKAQRSHLTGAVLEGLARYAHLINQDFFGDVLEVLKDLIEEADASFSDADQQDETDAQLPRLQDARRGKLLCMTTAFALLQGQVDVVKSASSLHLDLDFFITNLYRLLLPLSLDPDIELSAKTAHLRDPNGLSTPSIDTKVNVATTIVLLLRSLSAALLPPMNTRSVPPVRVAAFAKQILTSSLHLPEKSVTALLGLMSQVVKTHGGRIAALWNTEERKGDGIFNALSERIEASNPFAATVWEGELLRHHFDPKVREGLKVVERAIKDVGK